MGAPYNGIDALHTTITTPSDGDYGAAGTAPGMEDLCDSIVYLDKRLHGDAGVIYWNIPLVIVANTAAQFSMATIDSHFVALQTNIAVGSRIVVPIPVPQTGILDGVQARIHGGLTDGHAGWPIGTYPSLQIWACDHAVLTDLTGGGISDAPTSQAAYERSHFFGQSSGLAQAIDADHWWYAVLDGEEGGNAEVNELGLQSFFCRYLPAV